jgi:hypothetical protein
MCDTMVHDAAARNEFNLKRLIDECIAAEVISFETTRVQVEQLGRIPPGSDIGQALAIPAKRTGLSMFFCGWSRLGEDRLGGPEVASAFQTLQAGNPKHGPDALIGITALTEVDVFVTNDRTLGKRFKKLGSMVKTMSPAEFASYLAGLLAANKHTPTPAP